MFLFLWAIWIIFNGAITLEIVLFGVCISAAVCFFMMKFTGYSVKRELKAIKKLPYIIEYLFVLLIEIIKANIACSGLIIKGNDRIQPVVVSFSSPLKSELLSTVLANSITLTPGTISVSMRNGQFTVHCLDSSLCDGIDSSSFVKILKKIEG